MSIRLFVKPGVAPAVAAETRRVLDGFRRVSSIRHPMTVVLVPQPAITNEAGVTAFGMCLFPLTSSERVRVYVAAGLADVCRENGDDEKTAARAVGHTLLHELAHYEQWRDFRTLQERGVNRRATGIYERIDAEATA